MADVGMVQRRHRMYFAREAVAEALGGDFDGYVAPHAWIARAVHLAHAARRDKRDDPIGAEGLAFPVQGQIGNLPHVAVHFFNPACQFNTTVNGGAAVSAPTGMGSRNFLPSGLTSQIIRSG